MCVRLRLSASAPLGRYGYIFGAAEVGVTHRIRRDVMLYPGYDPYLGRPPTIMHYGSDFKLGNAYFNKMMHQQLKLETCPAMLFDDPQLPIEPMSKRDALAQEHLSMLNAAFCKFYARIGCSNVPTRCGEFESQLRAVQPVIEKCSDDHEGCGMWARGGECANNPKFMHAHCGVACESCHRPLDELDKSELHNGDWKWFETGRVQKRKAALDYVATAAEEDLVHLEEAIASRREELTSKAEL